MLGHVVGVEAQAVVALDELQSRLVEIRQREVAAVEVVEDAEFQRSSPGRSAVLLQQGFQFRDQRGDFLPHRLPHDFGVHIEIGVDDSVAHADDGRPGDAGDRSPLIGGDAGCSLTDDLDGP